MTLNKIGLNVSNIGNINPPNFNFKNDTTEFINDIPNKANLVTNNFLGLIISTALFGYLYITFSKSENFGGDFGFSPLRSLGLSAIIVNILGLVCLNLGYFTNYYHIAIFIIIGVLSVLGVWKSNK